MAWCGVRRVLAAAALVAAALPAPPALRPCPSNPLCVCSDDHLACNNVPFHRFPEIASGVRHVSLWRARLGALEPAALDGRPLRTLVLPACRLHTLHPAALASMESTLASLDLGYNEFTEVPIESLRGLRVLNWLNLQNNDISDLDEHMEWGQLCETLTSLSLSNNRLGVVRAGALAALRRLARLDLDGNQLRALAPAALPPALALLRLARNLLRRPPCARLPRLRHLQLRDNLLARAPPALCAAPPAPADSLDLSQNHLDDSFDFGFLSGYRLRRLALDLNDLTRIPSLPPEAGRLERLSMSHNMLKEVSDAAVRALSRDLEHLDLDHNELAALPAGVRALARLRHLSVSYNRLERLEWLPPRLGSLAAAGNYLAAFPAALARLAPASLRRLDLGYNRLAAVPRDTFGPWAAALDALDLRGNLIAQLAADAFPPTLPLRDLSLSFNDLYLVDRNAFANLTNLKVLGLSSAVLNGDFPLEVVSPDLVWLTLDNNNIHRVTSDDLHGLESLEYLNLDFNKIVVFPSETNFINFNYSTSKLKELRLAYNYIVTVIPEFIIKLTELESVDLSYNRMRNVSERCFASLGNLVHLSLAGNLLEFVAEKAFYNLPKLEVLDLQENYLSELSLDYFENLASEEVALTVNASYNRISSLVGSSTVFITVLDLSHNSIEHLSGTFFDSLGRSVRQILLSHNRLVSIDSFCSGTLPNLHILNLSNNSIGTIRRRAFGEVPALQLLDLSHNRLGQLSAEQFGGARRLRQLRLAANELRALPADCLRHTLLEHLDLAHNRLAALPAPALAHVGFTLRRLDLAGNRLQRLHRAAFRDTAFLHELDLARNALTALPDDALAGLERLTSLDLSHNAVSADFEELLRGAPELRSLALADAGLRAVPPLPLANLTRLDLSGNRIPSFRDSDLRPAARLRHLDVARNELTSLRPTMWASLPRLTHLDVSRNPIVRIGDGAFEGLSRLVELRMDGLRRLEALEPRSFRALRALRALRLELGAAGALARVLGEVPSLEALTLSLRARALEAQLRGVRAPKLRWLELRGAVSGGALSSLGGRAALALVVRGAAGAGLLRGLARVPLLSLEVAGAELEPAALYDNLTEWNRVATKLLSGGLVVSGGRLRCGCAVWWVGAWLRRWVAEVGGGARAARAAAARSWCVLESGGGGGGGGGRSRLVSGAEHAGCPARALSSHAPPLSCPAPAFLWIVLLHSLS